MQIFDPNPHLTFGEWLRARRIALELTREQLAQRAFCSVVTVNKLQSNQLTPSVVLAEALAAALAVPEAQRESFVRFARSSRSERAEPSAASTQSQPRATPDDPALTLHPAAAVLALRLPALPAPVTSFIGREGELQQLISLLMQPHVRLLTLTGPPGTGKTRLGLELARCIAADYPDGATFIALSPLADAALVLKSIVQQLGLSATTAESKSARDILIDGLHQRRTLIVLDNFEHVLDAAPELAALLTGLPQLKFIVTSREPLRIYGEQEFQVGPLALPAVPLLSPSQSPAITLFVERASLVRPSFALTSDNADDIAALCILLDGLPLAIEMAAARIRQASPRQLLEQLRQRVDGLSDGMRGRDPRQQSMHSAIAWSHRLLQPHEQRLFETLSVFAGGCTLDALSTLYPNPDEVLQSLIDKSLVQVQQPSDISHEPMPARYSQLHVVREFAQARLSEAGRMAEVREAHLHYFAHFAEACERQMAQPGAVQVHMMNIMEAEHNNVRTALEWALHEEGDRALGVRLASAYGWFWLMRGYVNEALDHLQRALDFARQLQHPPLLAKALERAGALAAFRADLNVARTMLSECIEVARHCEADATVTLGEGLWELGVVLRRQRQFALAQQSLLDSVAHGRRHQLPFVLDAALAYLGDVCSQMGQHEDARRYLDEALDIAVHINDTWGTGLALRVMGDVLQKQGDYSAATDAYLRSLPPARAIGDRINQAFALSNLAVIANLQGDFAASRAHAEEGLHILHSTGLHQHIPFLERMLAYAEVQLGNLDRAVQVCAQSLRSNVTLGHPTGIAGNWLCQAEIALARGDVAAARQHMQQAEALVGDLSKLVRPDAEAYARVLAGLRGHRHDTE